MLLAALWVGREIRHLHIRGQLRLVEIHDRQLDALQHGHRSEWEF